MPKISLPEALRLSNQKKHIQEFMKENRICSFEEFCAAIYSGKFNQLRRLNYLDTYIHDLCNLKEGHSVLISMILNHQLEVVRFLIEEGIDTSVRVGITGFTALHYIVIEKIDWDIKKTIMELLLKYSSDIEAFSTTGLTPLHLAAFNGDSCVKEAELLLEHGANLHARSREKTDLGIEGSAPLHLAVKHGFHEQEKMIPLLLSKGADIEGANDLNCTPLQWAAVWGQDQAMTLLLNHGAKIDAVSHKGATKGLTALHLAAQNNRMKCVEVLMQRGADINARNASHQTPAEMAKQAGYMDVVNLLNGIEKPYTKYQEPVDPNFESLKNIIQKMADSLDRETSAASSLESQSKTTHSSSNTNHSISQVNSSLVTYNKPAILAELKRITPNFDWKFSSQNQAWLQVADKKIATSILKHFNKHGYKDIRIKYRADDPSIPVLVLKEVELTLLSNLPIQDEEKIHTKTATLNIK